MRALIALVFTALAIGGCAQTSAKAVTAMAEGKVAPQSRSFPEISDWQSLRITYSRGGPPWVSPGYRIEISGDGAVKYVGDANVATVGKREGRIEQTELHKLVDQFRAADFFNLNDAYRDRITDQDRIFLTISFDGLSKSVEDYAGLRVGMPVAVAHLQQVVVSASGASQWTGF